MIRFHIQDSWFDVEDMNFDQAAALHRAGEGTFHVSARRRNADLSFRRMSIAVNQVISVEELP